jgi:hypothetical protein
MTQQQLKEYVAEVTAKPVVSATNPQKVLNHFYPVRAAFERAVGNAS